MAIQEADGIHNSLGSVVYYMRKGKRCMRLKSASFTDARTPNQLKHREKMRQAGEFTASCKRFLTIGFQDAPVSMDNPSNEARSYIIIHCFDTTGDQPVLDFSKVAISRGYIQRPEIINTSVDGQKLVISWRLPYKGEEVKPDDRVMVMVYSDYGIGNKAHFFLDVATRGEGAATVLMPFSTEPIHAWMFFHNPNAATGESKKKISDSVYLGEFSL